MEIRLGDIITLLTDYHANGSYETLKEHVDLLDDPNYALMVRTTNFEQNDFEKNNKYITEDAYNYMEKSKVFPYDILMNKIANAGSVYLMPDLKRPVSLAMNLFLIRVDSEKVNPIYIFNHLKLYEPYIKQYANGTATKTITKEAVRNLKFRFPSIQIQTKIASILSSYDELIENNKQRIKLLEEMAAEIYKEWFVRMRFPGYETARFFDEQGAEVKRGTEGGLPEGWKMTPVNSFINIISGFAFKTESFDNEGLYKLVTIKNVQDGYFVTETTDSICELPKNLKEECKLKDKDIILSLTGNIGRICMVYGENYLLNQRVAKLQPTKDYLYEFIYLMFKDKFFRSTLENISNGAAQQNLSPIEMGKLEVPLANEETLKQFSKITNSFFDEIIVLNKKNQLLQQTRDLLLPRLISGKLSVEHLLGDEHECLMAAEPKNEYKVK